MPSYQQRLKHGKKVAYVTLTDSVTHKRKDIYLGEYDAPESREKYKRLLTEWQACGERVADDRAAADIVSLATAYQDLADATMADAERCAVKRAGDFVVDLYGSLPVKSFGPKELKLVREAMINHGWARRYINHQVRRVIRMFKWGVGEGHVPPDTYIALTTVEALRQGKTRARDTEPVGPVDDKLVDPIKPFVSDRVWAVIELQRLTGARPGELLKLRKGDIEQEPGAAVWRARLKEHKTAHHRHSRTLVFGPQSQKILAQFMLRPDDAYLFSPREAEKVRREARSEARRQGHGAPLSCGNRPGTNCQAVPKRTAGDRYTRYSYRNAIMRACDRAFPLPEELRRAKVPARGRKTKATRWETEAEWQARLGDRWRQVEQWRKDHRWHPHQLRHAAATKLRKQFGLEAAQVWLGHSSALVTDAVYAERDQKRLDELASQIG